MATVTLAPLVLRDMQLTLDGDVYSTAISSAQFTPSTSTSTWTAIDGSTVTDAAPTTWVLDLTFRQDWDTAGSLSERLFDGEGESVTALLEPRNGEGSSFSATVTLASGAVGGTAGSNAEATVSLGSTKPTRVPEA